VMGYCPPPPPGVDYIEVTCLEDAEPRYVPRYGRAGHQDNAAAYLAIEHRGKMATMHAETMLGARIGMALLLALAVDVIAMVAGL
jgi:hypothetical protein